MSGFSITEAAFTGFRIARQRPRAVATWVVIQLIVSLVLGGAIIAVAGPDLMRLRELGAAGAGRNSAAAMVLFQRLAPLYGLVLVYLFGFSPLLYGAMNRAVMRPADDHFGYFRLGADEARQFVLIALIFALAVGVYLAGVLFAAAIGTVVSLVARPAVAPAVLLCMLAGAGAAIYLTVRLSLASAQTFAAGRVTLLGSWALTRGRFWPILGTYGLAGVFAAVVYVLWFVLTFAIVAAVGGVGAVSAAMAPNLTSLATFFTPAAVAQSVLSAIVTALLWPVLGAPPAAIYQRLAGPASGAAV